MCKPNRAKDFLREIAKIDCMIKNKLDEIEQWKSIATSTTTHSDGERVQSSGSQQKMADAVVEYVDIESDIKEDIKRLKKKRKYIISIIEKLDVVYYDLLHMVYVQYKTLSDVAEKYDNSYTWATTTHGRALQAVETILNEGVEKWTDTK